ncbi:Hpt domain-containing protein [Shewanella sp. YIC-542]|uniref:Hpt domain-containing protein n=1 Tax=Shewanella mytili TaxID=3377111 RepID=UPI00398EBD52
MATSDLDTILDLNTLEQYCSAIGAGTLLKSVVLFEQLLPEYLNNLQQAADTQNHELLCSEAHKFKGAAGSVGLKRIHYYAQLLQHGDTPEWAGQHPAWLKAITQYVADDLQQLKAFLQAKA